jgi:uncharacterized phage-associated protein
MFDFFFHCKIGISTKGVVFMKSFKVIGVVPMVFTIFLFFCLMFPVCCFSSTEEGMEGGVVGSHCASALDVAAYIVERFEPDRVESLKLQKSLYFCQKQYLSKHRAPLFEDSIEAWVHGPVVPNVYKNHRKKIFVTKELFGDSEKLNPQQKEIVENILDQYKNKTGWYLREESHLEKPWIEARAGLDPDASSNAVITPEAILESIEKPDTLCTYDLNGLIVAKPTSFEELEKLRESPVNGIDLTLCSFFGVEEVEILKTMRNLSYIKLRGTSVSLEIIRTLIPILDLASFGYLDICQTPAAEENMVSFVKDASWKEKIIFIDRAYLGEEDVEKEFTEQLPYHIVYYESNMWGRK